MRVGVRDTLIQFTFPALKCRFLNKLSVLSQSRSISSFFLFLSLFLLFFFNAKTIAFVSYVYHLRADRGMRDCRFAGHFTRLLCPQLLEDLWAAIFFNLCTAP